MPSSSGWARRKQQVQRVILVVTLLIAGGLFVWKYGAELTWSPAPSQASEGSEE